MITYEIIPVSTIPDNQIRRIGYRVALMEREPLMIVRPIRGGISLMKFHELQGRYGFTFQTFNNNCFPFTTKTYVGFLYFAEGQNLIVVEPLHRNQIWTLFTLISESPNTSISTILDIMNI